MPIDEKKAKGIAAASEGAASASDLKKAAEALKAKIAEARARNDMPLNSALGNPNWEKAAADGRFDVPDDED